MHPLFLLVAILGSAYGQCQNGAISYPTASKLTCEQKQFIVDLHNFFRNRVASGEMPMQPMAADMVELRWSEEAANMAQEWTNYCVFEPTPHEYRKLNGELMGQNLAILSSTADIYKFPNLTRMMHMWFNENGFDLSREDNESRKYKQLIWAKTKYVGCGLSYFYTEGWYYSFLACNYLPAGNVVGRRPYTYGERNCAPLGMVPSRQYSHLCALDYNVVKVPCGRTQDLTVLAGQQQIQHESIDPLHYYINFG